MLVFAGIALCVLGFFLAFGKSIEWMEGSLGPSHYDVKAGSEYTFMWYFQKGDRTEINFAISGGREEVRFYIRNPSGAILCDMRVVGSMFNCSLDAEDSGVHSFTFENLDNVTDTAIHANFQLPHGLRPTNHYREGYLAALGGIVTLLLGMFSLYSLHYDKDMKQSEDELRDPTKFDFTEIFITRIGRNGKILRYWMRCILFGITIYIIGGVGAVLSNTLIPNQAGDLTSYFFDIYFLTLSIVTGLTPLFAIRALRGLHAKLVFTDRHFLDNSSVEPEETDRSIEVVTKRLEDLLKDMRASSTWLDGRRKRARTSYYYSLLAVFSAIGLLVGVLTVRVYPNSWIGSQHAVSSVAFIFCCMCIGLTVGALIFISLRGVAFLSYYCQKYVFPAKVPAFTPDKLVGLKKVGEFSADLNLAAAIPSIAFFASYLSGTQILGAVSLICLSTYTVVLFVILVLPLRPFHAKMVSVKEESLKEVNRRFRAVNSRLSQTGLELENKLDICEMHDRIVKRPVWPLDLWIDSRFMSTVSLPVLLSILSNLLSRLLELL